MKMRMRTEFQLLGEPELEKCFREALKVWRAVEFKIQGTDEYFDLLSSYGCQVDGEAVRFPEPVISKVLARIADEKRAWDEKNANRVDPWPASDLTTFTHGQGLHICDTESNEIRPATESDLIQWCHLADALDIPMRSHPTFIPTDVPLGSADFHAFAQIVLNSRMPHRVSVYSARTLPLFIEACSIAKGSLEEVKKDPVFATKCWVNSPFMITRENIEVAMDARRLIGAPLTFGHMPVAAAAAPVTLAGALVQNTAESLALCAMRLAVDDLTSGITGTSATIDMRDACHRQTGPDLTLHLLAGSEMHAYLFGGRTTASINSVAAQTVSPQSLYEKAMYFSFNVAAGRRQLGVGCLAVSDIGSPVQLVLDCEMVRFFQKMFSDIAVDDEHIGLDTILSTIPRGAYYLDTDHTAEFFREESWFPEFVDHRPPLAWVQNPTDMVDRGRAKTRELIAGAENRCPLSDVDRNRVRELIADADRLTADA